MTKESILEVCSFLENDLKRKNKGRKNLTVLEQVLISLKLLASGSFQNSSKDNINVSQSAVSRVLASFKDSLISKKERFIYMPNPTDAAIIKQQFCSIAHFPAIIGAID